MKINKIMIVTIFISIFMMMSNISVIAADEIVTDDENDVIDFAGEYVDYPNIDITELTYTKVDTKVTLTLQVKGEIEDLGNINLQEFGDDLSDFEDFVSYTFLLETSEDSYNIFYINQYCFLTYSGGEENITDFNVDGSILEINFDINNSDETYVDLFGESVYFEFSLSEEDIIYYLDTTEEYPLEATADIPNLGETGKNVKFSGYPLFGKLPYTYIWDFGDGSTSSEKNPTHIYEQPGTYTVKFTVTDAEDESISYTGEIEISGENGNGGDNNQIMMFFVVIAIIVIIGVAAVIYIIRR
jgi:hypothetical protein